MAQPGESMRYFVRHLAKDLPLHRRVGRVVRAMADPGMEHHSLSGHCEVAARLATRLGMAEAVCQALAHGYERWDGKGHPAGLAGEEVPVAIRVVAAARAAGLSDAEATTLGRAALVHDVGRVGVASGIWDRPGPLSADLITIIWRGIAPQAAAGAS